VYQQGWMLLRTPRSDGFGPSVMSVYDSFQLSTGVKPRSKARVDLPRSGGFGPNILDVRDSFRPISGQPLR
jgi:hypothetical protein